MGRSTTVLCYARSVRSALLTSAWRWACWCHVTAADAWRARQQTVTLTAVGGSRARGQSVPSSAVSGDLAEQCAYLLSSLEADLNLKVKRATCTQREAYEKQGELRVWPVPRWQTKRNCDLRLGLAQGKLAESCSDHEASKAIVRLPIERAASRHEAPRHRQHAQPDRPHCGPLWLRGARH